MPKPAPAKRKQIKPNKSIAKASANKQPIQKNKIIASKPTSINKTISLTPSKNKLIQQLPKKPFDYSYAAHSNKRLLSKNTQKKSFDYSYAAKPKKSLPNKKLMVAAAIAAIFVMLVVINSQESTYKISPLNNNAPTLGMTDKNGAPVESTITLKQGNYQLSEVGDYIGHLAGASPGKYEAEIKPAGSRIKKISVHDFIPDKSQGAISLDDAPAADGSIYKDRQWADIYAIKPTAQFSSAEVTLTAKAETLYKCKDWDFDSGVCKGSWVKYMNLNPGQDYTIKITSDDPGFGEINITNAEHLDENYAFISNIYEQAREEDNIWTEQIPDGHYARATFAENLTNGNIINIVARGPSYLEIYKGNTQEKVGQTQALSGEAQQYDIKLANVSSPSDLFDIKTTGTYAEYDYIHDANVCQILNETLTLTGDIEATDTCIRINANNIQLDCAGFAINYATTKTGIGVDVNDKTNVNITNCIIKANNINTTNNYGIRLLRTNNSIVQNNTVLTNGTSGSEGIRIDTKANYNKITSNTIGTNGNTSGAVGISVHTSAVGNNLTNNIINTQGKTTTNYGIYLTSQVNNTYVANNKIATNGTTDNYGIYLLTNVFNNTLLNNTIYTNGTSSDNYGIYLDTNTANNTVLNNTVFTNGSSSSVGIRFNTRNYFNIVSNNIINTLGRTGANNYGIQITSSNGYNNITNNVINTQGASTINYGIYLTTQVNNTYVANNIVSTMGSSTNYGIYLLQDTYNNTLLNNTVYTNGTSGANYGIYLSTDAVNNSLLNNTIYTNGTSSNYGIYLLTRSNDNVVDNNRITTWGYSSSTGSDYGILVQTSSVGNNLTNNIISTGHNNTGNNHGIYLNSQVNNTYIANNNISTKNGVGIYFFSSLFNNTVLNNTVLANGTGGVDGITLDTRASNNNILNNTIISTGNYSNRGIVIDTISNYNLVDNNNIKTYGTQNYVGWDWGIEVVTSSVGNSLTNNRISTSHDWQSLNHGILLTSQVNNTYVANNIVSTMGSSTNYGIYLLQDTYNNTLLNNTISTNGTSNNNHGIFLDTRASNNSILNNTIRTNGTGTNDGIRLTAVGTGSINTLDGNNITTFGSTTSYGINILTSNNTQINNTIIDKPSQWINIGPTTNNTFTNTMFVSLNGSIRFNGSFYIDRGEVVTIAKMNVTNNVTYLNATNLSWLNTTAIISMTGLAFTTPQLIFSGAERYGNWNDFALCPPSKCQNKAYSSGTLSFTANGFTTYAANETPSSAFSCGVLNQSLTLGADVSSSGTCFNINQNNIELDCAGYTINYATTKTGIGIDVNDKEGVTIKNCVIKANNVNTTNNYGIRLLRTNSSIIQNNTVYTNGTSGSEGIRLDTKANYNKITSNTIGTNGNTSGAVGISVQTSAVGNNLTNNKINTQGKTTTNYGIYLNSQVNNTYVANNIIATNGTSSNFGIYLFTNVFSNAILNNTISTNGTGASNHGIYLSTDAVNNSVLNNTIFTNGTDSNYGIYLLTRSNNNLIDNNRIATWGYGTGTGTDYGILVQTSSVGNNITNNIISTWHNNTGNNYGIYLNSQTNNTYIANNIIATNGTSSNIGIYLFTNVFSNTLLNNTISTNGSSSSNYGIFLTTNVANNSIINNTISTNGTSSNIGIYLFTRSNDNVIDNNNISTFGSTAGYDHGIAVTTSSVGNNITNNIIKTQGATTYNYGIVLETQVNNTYIANNIISTNGTKYNYGVHLNTDVYNNTITNNTINSNGTTSSNYGIYLFTRASSNIINYNRIYATSWQSGCCLEPTSRGIVLSTTSNYNILDGNNISTLGYVTDYEVSVSHGIQVDTNIVGTNITNNRINTQSTGTANYGIYLVTRVNNTYIAGNTISTNGTLYNYGIILYTNTYNNTILNNTISTNGTTNNYGIYLLTNVANNSIVNNTIRTNGTGTNDGIRLTAVGTGNINTLDGNNITTFGSTTSYGINILTSNDTQINNTIIDKPSQWLNIGPTTNTTFTNTMFVSLNGSIRFNGSFYIDRGEVVTIAKMNVTNNVTYLNATNLSWLNTTAIITMTGLAFTTPQIIFSGSDRYGNWNDFALCPPSKCQNKAYSSGTLSFTANGFSTYAANETPSAAFACGVLNQSLTLGADVSAPGTCFSINQNNIELDCAGFTINYATTITGIGIDVNNKEGVTIKNCIIKANNVNTTNNYGIRLLRTNSSLVQNNTIYTNGTSGSEGIRLDTKANYNQITSNTIGTNGNTSGAVGISVQTSAVGNNMTNNIINTQGKTTANYGIYLTTQANNTYIANNKISTNGTSSNYGIYGNTDIYSSTLLNNTIYTNGTSTDNHGIYLFTSANNNNILNNTIFTNGTFSNIGINIRTTSSYNVIDNNNISAWGYSPPNGGNLGIQVQTSSVGNNITNNVISAAGNASNTNYGILLTSQVNNTYVANNIISTYGSNTNYGIHLLTNVFRNTLLNNTISTNGTTSSNYGIFLSSTAGNNSILNNRIFTNGFSSSYGIYIFTTSSYNVIDNNNISTIGIASGSNYGIYLQTSSVDANITNNIINTQGEATSNYGIYLNSQVNSTYISGNIISTNGTSTNYGIYLSSRSSNNTVTNNAIYTNGTTDNYGIFVNTASNYNVIDSNNVSTFGRTGGTNRGIYLLTSVYGTNVTNNIINTQGTTTQNRGIQLATQVNSTYVANNIISTNGTSDNYGILLYTDAYSNTILNNTISTNGTTDNYGIYLLTDVANNSIINNTIRTNGTGTNDGIRLTAVGTGNINTLDGNNITTFGSTTSYGINILTSNNTQINNTIIDKPSQWLNIGPTTNTTFTNTLFVSFNGSIRFNGSFYIDRGEIVTIAKLNVTANVTYLNATNLSWLNTTAIISMTGLAFTTPQIIFSGSDRYGNWNDFALCPPSKCQNKAYSSGTLSFTANGFSTYAANETPSAAFACGVLNQSLTLGADVSAPGTCFSINSNNIELDCAGYTINYATTITGIGIDVNDKEGVTIKNCVIKANNVNTTNNYGIRLLRTNNSIIRNNTVYTNGTTAAHGIYVNSKANYNQLINNTVNTYVWTTGGTSDTYGIYLSTSIVGTNITGNIINTNANSSADNYGIYLTTQVNSTFVSGNTISTNGTSNNYGIYLQTDTYSNTILNNSVSTNGSSTNNYGIYLLTRASNNTILSNTIFTNGTRVNIGIGISTTSNYNLIDNNKVTTWGYGTGTGLDYGISIGTSSVSNNITNNIISTGHINSDNNYGITLSIQVNNTYVANNNISTNGTRYNYGIYLNTDTYNNTITNNTINSNGTTSSNYGIFLSTTASNNTISYNTIFANGFSSSYGIYIFTTSSYNIINNNNISTFGRTAGNDHGIIVQTSAVGNNLTNNIISTQGNTTDNYGIYLTSQVNNTYVANNIISTNGTTNNYGIYLASRVFNNIILNNTISTNGTTSQNYGIILSGIVSNNTIQNNTVRTNGTGTNYGIYIFDRSDYNVIDNNKVSTWGYDSLPGGYGIRVQASSVGNNVTNNIISTGHKNAGDNGGILLFTQVNNTYVANNIISTNGTTGTNGNIGIYLITDVYSNTILNNTISTNGTSNLNHGIFLSTNVANNSIINNTILTNGTSSNYGVYLSTITANNTIRGNNITTMGTTGGSNYGVFISTTANDNNIIGNVINTNGNTTNNYGIYLNAQVNNTLISGNTISTNGTTGNNGIYLLTNVNSTTAVNNTIIANGTATTYAIAVETIGAGNTALFDGNNVTANNDYSISITASNVTFNNTILSNPVQWMTIGKATNITFTNTMFVSLNGSIRFNGSFYIDRGEVITIAKLNVTYNRTFLNATNLSFMNTTAIITMTGLSISNAAPVFNATDSYHAGQSFAFCPASKCSGISFLNNVLTFTTNSFTSFAAMPDTAVPVVAITQPQNATYNTGNVTLNFTITDDSVVENCTRSLDNVNSSLAGCTWQNLDEALLGEGSHNIIVWATDAGGNTAKDNVSFTLRHNLLLNSTFNRTGALREYNRSENANISAVFRWDNDTTIQGAPFNVTFRWNNSAGTVVREVNFTPTSAGNVWDNWTLNTSAELDTWWVRMTGFALQNGTLRTIVNETPFNVTIGSDFIINITNPQNRTYIGGNITLNYTVFSAAPISECAISLDGVNTSTQACANQSYDETKLGEGSHTIIIWVNDTGKNVRSNSVTFNFTHNMNLTLALNATSINQTQTINITTGNATWANGTAIKMNVQINWTAPNGTLVRQINFSTNNTNGQYWDNFTANISSQNGTWAVFVTQWVYQNSTIRMQSNKTTFTMNDVTAPQILIQSPSAITYATTSVLLNYTAGDNIALSQCIRELDSTNSTLAGCGNITLSSLSNSEHTLVLWVNDTLSNKNRSVLKFTVDTLVPNISFVSPTPANASNTTRSYFFVNVSVADTSNSSAFIDITNKTGQYSLLGYWSFDNHTLDNSTYGNNGTASNINCSLSAYSRFGTGCTFNGNGYVNITSPLLPAPDQNISYTYAAWFNPNNLTARQLIIGNANYSSSAGTGIEIFNNSVRFFKGNGSAAAAGNISSGWHHAAGVYVRETRAMSLYVDGVLSGTAISSATDAGGLHRIGSSTANTNFFNGTLDEVFYFTRDLSGNEAYALSNSTSPFRNFTGLSAANYTYYSYVTDAVGNSNRTETRVINVTSQDAVPPIVNNFNITYPSTQGIVDKNKEVLVYEANATDDIAIDRVFITDEDEFGSLAMVFISGNVYRYNTTFTVSGSHTASALARDTSGNTAQSASLPYTVIDNTAASLTPQPSSITISNVTYSENSSFVLTITFNNTGLGGAYNTNISLSMPTNISANATLVSCGKVGENGSVCTASYLITALPKIAAGNFTVNVTANWTNPDNTAGSNSTPFIVTIADKSWTASPAYISLVAYQNTSGNITINISNIGDFNQNISVNSTGNITQFITHNNHIFVANKTNGTVTIFYNLSLSRPIGIYNGSIILINRTAFPPEINITLQVNVTDNILPSISAANISLPLIEAGFASLNISANVTDNINISRVWANITSPQANSTNFMSNISNVTYRVEFTPSKGGVHNITIYANDTSGNIQTLSAGVFTSIGAAGGPTNVTPIAITVANMTFKTNVTLQINITLGNNGPGTMRYANITVIEEFSGAWSTPSKTQYCANISANTNCTVSFNITLPLGASSGSRDVLINSTWISPDLTINYTSNFTDIIVQSNPKINITNPSMLKTIDHGVTLTDNFTIEDVGNALISGISYNISGGNLPISWLTLDPTSGTTTSLAAGANFTVLIQIAVPQSQLAGSYATIMNATSSNGGYDEMLLNVTVPVNGSWSYAPSSISASTPIGTSGNFTINVTNLGNINLTFAVVGSGNATGMLGIPDDRPTTPGIMFPLVINYSIPSGQTPGVYGVTMQISNASGSPTLQSTVITMIVGDTAPTIAGELVTQTAFDLNFQTTDIRANVTDNNAVSSVIATVYKPSGVDNITLAKIISTNTYNATYTPDQAGNYTIVINATDNSGLTTFSSPVVFNVTGATTVKVTSNISSITLSNITLAQGATIPLNITFNNTGTGAARHSNLTFSLPSGWSASQSTIPMGNISKGTNATTTVIITVPANTSATSYTITPTATWTQPNQSLEINTTSITVTVSSNPVLRINEDSVTATTQHGTTLTVNATLNSTGNAVATNASLLCTSALCTNFSVTFNVSSLTLAQNAVRVGINISVPLGQDPGVYSLTVNTSTSSDYMIINVTVPTNTSWTRSPASLPDVKIGANTAGNFNTLNITSFANVIILLNISIEGNITNYTTTNVTQLSLGKLETVSVRVNFTSPSVGGIYNGNVTITNSSGVPSQLNTSLLLNVTQFTITIISPTSTSIINTSAGSLINITANATLAGEAIAENITWTVAVGGSSCAVNSSSFSAGWLIRCAAPSLPDGVLYNLQLTGNYTTLVTVSTQTETNAVRYTDSSPPQFASISRPLVEKGNNVTIIANITENTNVSAVTINITYPNGTIQKFNMTNISSDTARSNWTVLITDATARGDYDFTITANDTFGNQNSSSSFFSIFEPVSVSGTSLDPDNDVINMTLKFYRENHNLSANTLLQTVATLGNGSYSGTINNRTYDLEVDYGGHSLVFKNVNVSNNVIDPVLLDDLPTKYMTITGSRGPLKGLAVKSNINASSINVTFSFTGTAFTHINAIKLYKCAVHNFTQPSLGCTGTWEKLSPVLNVVNETAYATVSTLSIFAAAEEVRCGDNICDINFGESSVTCSADCGSASTGASGGGGGGGGGISQSQLREELQTLKKSTATPQSFSVETDLIDTIMSPGETKIFSLFLSNNEDKPAESIISAIGPATRFLTFDNTHVSINGSETALVKITAYIPEDTLPGIYSGDVQITVGDEQRNMPVTITVASEKDAVIDVALDIITKEVELNSSLRFKVTLTNIGFQKHKALNITYNVREASSESLIASFHENITLDETRSTFTRAFSMMGVKNITLGKYFLEAVISYNDKTSVAIDLFDVVEQFWTPFRVMLVTLSAGSLASVYAGYRIRKAYLRRRSSKKRYASPLEWKSLPKGELWLGKIGETEKEATFKLDDLTTHVLTAGATGSGKSVSAMVIVEEALKKKLPVVVFDPTAQWTGFVRPDTEQGMLNTFKKFKMKQEDARPFKGLIYEITDVNVQIDIRKYMNPGEITVFTLNKLKPGEYDQAVQNIVNMIFSITWEESSSLKMLVCFDEVHRLLEKYGGKGGYTALEKACREFRKWGIGIVMVSQVLSDFKEALRGNVLTEVQMHTKLLEDIDRVKTKYGEEYSNRITRQEVGVGMIQNPKYNNGRPWFVNFRPLLHSPHKITESQMNTYKKFTSKMQEIETQIEELKTRKIDTTDIELELKLCKDKVKTGVFRTAEIYIESMEESLKRYKGRAAK